jgi:hypothetical protein
MTSGDATLRKLGAAERAPGDKPLARPAGLKWAQPSATTLCDPGALWRPVRCWCGLPDAYLPAFLPVRWIQSEQTRLPSPRNTACPITSNTPPTTTPPPGAAGHREGGRTLIRPCSVQASAALRRAANMPLRIMDDRFMFPFVVCPSDRAQGPTMNSFIQNAPT